MSQTFIGLLIALIGLAASHLNIQISHESILQVVGVIASVYGLLHAYWGRYRHGDIYWWGGSKSQDVNLGVAKQ